MTEDIIEKLIPKAKKKIKMYRVAEGNFDDINIRIVSKDNDGVWKYRIQVYMKGPDVISGNYEPFKTKFGANRYFNKLMKKHNPKEIDLMVDAL